MSRVLICAEAGINHGGSLETALEMADAASYAGADIVKYQTYQTEKLLRKKDKDFKTLSKLELSRHDWISLAKHCEDLNIEFLTTPGDLDSLKFAVEELGVKRIKIGSDDLTNMSLLAEADQTRLPLIISTGMATVDEIRDAIYGLNKISLLHCVSLYPCPAEKANLLSIPFLKRQFSCKVGYSDHTAKLHVVEAAVAVGAEIIEVHFAIDGESDCIDAAVSFNHIALRTLIYNIRELELILGVYDKQPNSHELAVAPMLRKGADGYRGINS